MKISSFLSLFLSFFILLCSNHSAAAVIGQRTFSIVNQCPYPVWFSANGSVAKNKTGGETCSTSSDCIPEAVCNTSNKRCYYAPPVPQSGQYKLAANGGMTSYNLPMHDFSNNKIWGGRVAGRTKCDSGVCETGDCGSGEGACALGKGFKSPTTIAEMTLNKNTSDFYDISLVNGMSIPVAMSPDLPRGGTRAYDCGAPGAVTPITNAGSCSWNMVTPSNDYKVVTAGGAACTSDATCTAPNVCGISSDSRRKPRLLKTCGKLIGFWNANEICGQDKTYGAPFNCAQPLPAPQQTLTLYNLYKCNQIDTCYKTGASNTCCGCVNWNSLGIDVPAPPETKACANVNPTWTSKVQPTLAWMKRACPTVYTYPYDDPSSTFTCKIMKNNVNSVNYVITFCPGGKTGGVLG